MTIPIQPVQLPVQRPGIAPEVLSPNAYAERCPGAPRVTQADARNPRFWFAVHEQRDVQNDGVHFGGRVYWSDALIPYVSAGQRQHKSRFQVSYDAAALAAGHLDDIILDVWQDGCWQEVGTCRESTLVALDLADGRGSSDAAMRARAVYEANLVAQRDEQNDAVMTLKAGAETATREAKMRQRRARATRSVAPTAPRPAAPRFADAADVERAQQDFFAGLASKLEAAANSSDRGPESLPTATRPVGTAEDPYSGGPELPFPAATEDTP